MAIIKGTKLADTKIGTAGPDTIYGYEGNDTLWGRAGNDTIWGGPGNDRINGETGNDFLRGEAGNDTIDAGLGDDVVYGGPGNDILTGNTGTDTVKGDAGKDIVRGGTGRSYLYGGDDDDIISYNPTTQNLKDVKGYLNESLLDGDAGTDTLTLFNMTKYTTTGTATAPTLTQVYMDGRSSGDIWFINPTPNKYLSEYVGQFKDMEKVTVTSAGQLTFSGYYGVGKGMDVTGTVNNDTFYSYGASDTFRGGGGNDDFHLKGGKDTVYSEKNDADRFYFDATYAVEATINGFNGAGGQGGDRLYFDENYGRDIDATITVKGGKTIFELEADGTSIVTVDKTGLEEGVDYFFI